MPKLDGFETLRQIRKKQISADVIMVTAANDRDSLEEALHLGIVDYLVKPFTFERFQIALQKYIAQHKALDELDTLSQKSIDFIMDSSRKKTKTCTRKGYRKRLFRLFLTT